MSVEASQKQSWLILPGHGAAIKDDPVGRTSNILSVR